MPNNKNYSSIGNDFIVSKTDINNNIYDFLIFARCDIINARVPPFIKVIGSYAFEYCDQLKYVEIPSNSVLQTIEEKSFITIINGHLFK